MSLTIYKSKREIVQAADKDENSWIGGVAECIDEIEDLPSAQPEPCEDAVSRKAVIDAIDEWKEACADSGHKETASDIMLIRKDFIELLPVTPKQRTGKWILDRSGAYCCSECMEPCAGYVMMKPRDKFCKMCGAKMEV